MKGASGHERLTLPLAITPSVLPGESVSRRCPHGEAAVEPASLGQAPASVACRPGWANPSGSWRSSGHTMEMSGSRAERMRGCTSLSRCVGGQSRHLCRRRRHHIDSQSVGQRRCLSSAPVPAPLFAPARVGRALAAGVMEWFLLRPRRPEPSDMPRAVASSRCLPQPRTSAYWHRLRFGSAR